MQSGPPDTLNGKHQLILLAVLAGRSNVQIAADLGVSANRVAAIKASPLFQTQLDTMRRDLHERTAASLVERLLAEGDRSLAVAIEIRDNAEDERVRLNAAQDLMDRHPQLRKVQKTESDTTHRIILSGEDVTRMVGVLVEVDGVGAADGPRNGAEAARRVNALARPPEGQPDPVSARTAPVRVPVETLEECIAGLRALADPDSGEP